MAEVKPKIGYSMLKNGQIVWVYPEDQKLESRKRSRPESDEEVRVRLLKVVDRFIYGNLRDRCGYELDKMLKGFGLDARKVIDE